MYPEINCLYFTSRMILVADKLAHKAQLAAETNNSQELYQITKWLAGKPLTCNQAGITNATGRLLTTSQHQLTRWQEYFKNNLAAPLQQMCMITIKMTPDITKIPSGAPTGNKIKITIKHLKLKKPAVLIIYQQKFLKPIRML